MPLQHVGQPIQLLLAMHGVVNTRVCIQPCPGKQGIGTLRRIKQAMEVATHDGAVVGNGTILMAIQPQHRGLQRFALRDAVMNFITANGRTGEQELPLHIA